MPAFAHLPICTERLSLRPLRDGDADALFRIFSDSQVMRYWSTLPWTSPEPAQAMIASDQAQTTREQLRLGIERRQDQRLLGTCSLFAIHRGSRRAELGYALGAFAWGQGYMAEALQALLDYGFGVLDLNRIEADADPRNSASTRSLERLGFSREGLLRGRWIVGDEVCDTALYGLLRSDWRDPPLWLRPMREADLPMLHDWLNRPHIVRWWGGEAARPTLAEVQAHYRPRVLAEEAVKPYIATLGGRAVAYAQSYIALGSGDGWWEDETDPGVRGIDQSLAHADQLGRGLGTRLVRALALQLFADPAVTKLQTDPAPDNLRAIRCYEKAGFVRQGLITTPDGPAVYMAQTRADFERARLPP